MKIHVISETPFIMKATGVHTAFMDHIELLKEKNDIQVVVNNEGTGDIFHGHTYGLYYLWKGRKYKGRRVFTAHVIPDSIKGSLPVWWLFMPFIRMGLKIVYSYADVCIAISPMVEKAIINTGAKTRIVNIYNPVNIDIWKRTEENRKKGRQMLGLTANEFVVLGVGQLAGRKGVDDFLDISESIPEVKFVWAGGRPFGRLTEGIKRINERFTNAGKQCNQCRSDRVARYASDLCSCRFDGFPILPGKLSPGTPRSSCVRNACHIQRYRRIQIIVQETIS